MMFKACLREGWHYSLTIYGIGEDGLFGNTRDVASKLVCFLGGIYGF